MVGYAAGAPLGTSIERGELNIDYLELVAYTEVSGTSVQSVSFTGLDLDTDRAYLLLGFGREDSTGAMNVGLQVNGDTTATNYYVQWLLANNAAVSSTRSNNHYLFSTSAAGQFMFNIWILATDQTLANKPRGNYQASEPSSSAANAWSGTWVWDQNANVTSIQVMCSTAHLGTYSRFLLFKVIQ